MTEKEDKEPDTVTYYGKKLYYLNPKIARLKPAPQKVPDYSNENIEDGTCACRKSQPK